MPVLHVRAVVHLDGSPLFVAARRVSLTEFTMVDRGAALSASVQDDGLFGASPSAMLLTLAEGGAVGFAGDIATNAVALEPGGVAVLTNAVNYTAQVAAGDPIRGLG